MVVPQGSMNVPGVALRNWLVKVIRAWSHGHGTQNDPSRGADGAHTRVTINYEIILEYSSGTPTVCSVLRLLDVAKHLSLHERIREEQGLRAVFCNSHVL